MKKSDIGHRLTHQFQQIQVKDRQIKFYSFNSPFVAHKTPVVIIADSLLRPELYVELIDKVLKDRPIYIFDSTSMYLTEFEKLSVPQSHEIFCDWINACGLDRIILVAMGLNTNLGMKFATVEKEKCDKLILGGATPTVRSSVKAIILDQMKKLEMGQTESFAKGLSYLFSNFNFKDKIDRSESYRMAFERHIRQMNNHELNALGNDLQHFLEAESITGNIECATLIIQAEYDSVTSVHEGLNVGKKCVQSQLAILECLDHLAPLQNMKVITRLMRRFLAGEALNRMTGVELYTKPSFPLQRMQLTPRYQFGQVGFLDSGNGVLIPVEIVDINKNGCRLFTTFGQHRDLGKTNRFILSIPDRDLKFDIIMFDSDGAGHMRAVFVCDDSLRFKQMNDALELIAMEFEETPLVA